MGVPEVFGADVAKEGEVRIVICKRCGGVGNRGSLEKEVKILCEGVLCCNV